MGDLMIKGSGVFFDIDKFSGPDGMTREFFGPYSWRFEKKGIEKTAGQERYVFSFVHVALCVVNSANIFMF